MIETISVTEKVLQYYKENIISGAWKVGERIPSEHQLTEILGVSRASIRTAIRQLIGLGILESQQGKGTYLINNQLDMVGAGIITSKDCMDAKQVLEFRKIVEPEACFLATQYVTEEMIQKLSGYLDTMIRHIDDQEQFIAADVAFHQCICAGTRNTLLAKSMCRILEETKKDQRTTYSIDNLKNPIYFHTVILEALRAKNASQARQCMKQHLQSTLDLLCKKLEKEK